MSEHWIAERMHRIDASGIRKVFDLGARLKDPINLSIGQPHFDTPEPVKQALCQAIADGKNAYSQTQGIPATRCWSSARILSCIATSPHWSGGRWSRSTRFPTSA
jgi:hypothetical protein